MNLATLVTLVLLTLLRQSTSAPTTSPSISSAPPSGADELAADVMRASGGDNWPKVTRVKFTFIAGGDQQKLVRVHNWDVRKNTDAVTTDGKMMTGNLSGPNPTPDEKRALAIWSIDSYWLFAPLRLLDKGVIRSLKPDEQIDGKTYHVLHLAFRQVGLSPTDQYDLYIDPETKLVRWWDYIPAVGLERRFSWDHYKEYNGLKLAMEHRVKGELAIQFTDIEVTTE